MRNWLLLAAMAAVGLVTACTHDGRFPNECGMPAPGLYITFALDIQVRDPYGRGQAVGTTVVINGPHGTETDTGRADTLHIRDASGSTGTYSVTLSRPYYEDRTVSNIVVTANGDCPFLNTATVPVVLNLAPAAPAMRALILLGGQFLDHAGEQAQLIPHFDADPGVSTALRWSSSDTALVTVDANGLVTAKCVKDGGTATVTATSLYDGTTSGSALLGVAPTASCP